MEHALTWEKIKIGLMVIGTAIALTFASITGASEINLHRTLSEITTQDKAVFDSAIVPWINKEFSEPIEGLERKLVRVDLMRHETVDGEEHYLVHIEYGVKIQDSGVTIFGTKGQEIVFLIKNGQVEDFFPFDEYWIEYIVE